MLVKYIGTDPRELDGLGVVQPGDTIEVPDVGEPGTIFAGRAPSARYVAAMAELRAAHVAADHERRVALVREITGWIDDSGVTHPALDDGEGLLQQHELWQPATKKTTRPAVAGEEAQP